MAIIICNKDINMSVKINYLAFNIMKRQKGGIYMNHCAGSLGAAIILVLFILLIIIVGAYI